MILSPFSEGKTVRLKVKISVFFPPHSITLDGDQHRNKTENKATCFAEGNPKPIYYFAVGSHSDGIEPIESADGIYISPDREEDTEIHCIAHNDVFALDHEDVSISKLV